MNAKIKKTLSEMKKIEDKISVLQSKWDDLNKQKTELENMEIIGLVRGAKISTESLPDVLKAYRTDGVPIFMEAQEEQNHDET